MTLEQKASESELPNADDTDAFGLSITGRSTYRSRMAGPSGDGISQYFYRMNNRRRGDAIIINNRDFSPELGMNTRRGTDKDASSLQIVFNTLNFDVQRFDNCSTRDTKRHIRRAAQADHSDDDCFVLAMLSHGEDGIIFTTDGQIEITEITELFRGDSCPTLHGKPKLFFFQACRGTKLDPGADATDADPSLVDPPISQRIPVMSDFLLAYSVVPGFYSWRNSEKGSWFVQALAAVLEQHGPPGPAQLDLLTMLTRVNYLVATNFESNSVHESMSRKKQIPSIVSMLTKTLIFDPKS